MATPIKELEEIWHQPFERKSNIIFICCFISIYIYTIAKYGILLGGSLGWLPAGILSFVIWKLATPFLNRKYAALSHPIFKIIVVFASTFIVATLVCASLGYSSNEAVTRGLTMALIPPILLGLKALSNQADKVLLKKIDEESTKEDGLL